MNAFDTAPRLTRAQAAQFLAERGFPISRRYFCKLCLPGNGQGPRVDAWFNSKALYLPADVLEWAEARCRPSDKQAA